MSEVTTLLFDEILSQTDKALLVSFGDFQCWIPISQIANFPECVEENEITVAAWIVHEKGLEDYEL